MLVLLAALASAVAVGLTVLAMRPPPAKLAPRVAPFAQRARLMMGHEVDPAVLIDPDTAQPEQDRVLSPMITVGAQWLSNLVDVGGEERIAQRLRQAGRRDLTVEQYRTRQLASTAWGIALFTAVALIVTPSPTSVLAAVVIGGLWGATRWRAQIDRGIRARRARMRAELYTIAQLIAISLKAGIALTVTIRELTDRGGGAISDDLRDALDEIDHGSRVQDALERLAMHTPEPASARLYRLLATAESGSGDTLADSLLKMAGDLRTQRREDVERLATRRRFQMLIPTVALMGPVMLILLAAPIPQFILGR